MSSIEDLFARYGPGYRWLATCAAMISAVAVVLSSTIVNVAIPDVMGAFGISQVEAQWLSTGFLAAMTATMLLTDWADKAFGLRSSMNVALAVFIVGSLLGGLAPDENVLTVARVIQGAAAGIVQPLGMLLLFRVFPPNQRGTAMGIYGIGVVLAPALGPWIGGLLIDNLNWRYVFYLGVPFAVVGILLSGLFLPQRADTGPRPAFDWTGMVLLCLFLGVVLNAFTNGQRLGWTSDSILLQFAIACAAAAGFIFWEIRIEKPLLDLRVFANLPFASAALVAFILGAGLFGSTYLLPLFVQTIQGLTATQAGLLLMPSGFVLVVVFPLAGRLADRVPTGLLIGGGMAIFAWSAYLSCSIEINSTFWTVAWWGVLSRIGLGLVFPALTAGSLKVLPRELIGQGSGVINFIRQLGGAFGVNLLAVLLERRTAFHADVLAATQTSDNSSTITLLKEVAHLTGTVGIPDFQQLPAALWYLGQVVTLQANTLAFRDGFFVVMVIFLLALVPTWILHRAHSRA